MSSSRLTDPPVNVSFTTFQTHGFLIGGILPISIYILTHALGYHDSELDLKAFGGLLILSCLLLVIGVVVLICKINDTKPMFRTIAFQIQALLSFLLLHYLVAYTGGSKESVFAFSYLYIPAVVGYTYNSGINLLGASICLSYSYIKNLFGHEHETMFLRPFANFFSSIHIDPSNKVGDGILHLSVYVIQLIMIIYLASKSKSQQ